MLQVAEKQAFSWLVQFLEMHWSYAVPLTDPQY